MRRIESKMFDQLQIGDAASLVRTLTYQDIEAFAAMSGDANPARLDAEFVWRELPGHGTIFSDETLHFHQLIGLGTPSP